MQSALNDKNGARVDISFRIQPGLDDTVFNIFGNSDNKNVISSVVSVIGDQSGIRKDFTITITRPSA